MPPFEYTPYRNPYVQSISALMEQPANLEAQKAQAIAQIQARASREKGQIWANAISGAGQLIGQGIIEANDPKTKLAKIQLDEAGRLVKQRNVLGDIVKSTPRLKDGPLSLYDVPTITAKLADAGFGDHSGEVAKQFQSVNDLFRNDYSTKMALVRGGAKALIQAHGDPILVGDFLDTLEVNGSIPTESIAKFRQVIANDPSKTLDVLRVIAGAEELDTGAAGSYVYGKDTGSVVTKLPDKEETPTEAMFAWNLTNPNPEIRARASTALEAMKSDDVKPGSLEDWVRQSRALAAKATKEGTLTDVQKFDVDGKAIRAYRELSTDPAMAELMRGSAELRQALMRMQLDQMPTEDDAKVIAQQVVNHDMSPSQLSIFGGMGPQGAAFKRMVGLEAVKLDPSFNWEQAEADYQFSKSPGFQNVTRLMDSILESIPQTLKNAKLVANGNVRSINELINSGRDQFMDVNLAKLKTDSVLVGDEVAKILAGGGTGVPVSDAKLQQGQALLRTSDNPAVLAATLEEVTTLLQFRRKTFIRGTYLDRLPKETPPTTPAVPSGVIITRKPVTAASQPTTPTATIAPPAATTTSAPGGFVITRRPVR